MTRLALRCTGRSSAEGVHGAPIWLTVDQRLAYSMVTFLFNIYHVQKPCNLLLQLQMTDMVLATGNTEIQSRHFIWNSVNKNLLPLNSTAVRGLLNYMAQLKRDGKNSLNKQKTGCTKKIKTIGLNWIDYRGLWGVAHKQTVINHHKRPNLYHSRTGFTHLKFSLFTAH